MIDLISSIDILKFNIDSIIIGIDIIKIAKI